MMSNSCGSRHDGTSPTSNGPARESEHIHDTQYFKNGQRITGDLSSDAVIYDYIDVLIENGQIADYLNNISPQEFSIPAVVSRQVV